MAGYSRPPLAPAHSLHLDETVINLGGILQAADGVLWSHLVQHTLVRCITSRHDLRCEVNVWLRSRYTLVCIAITDFGHKFMEISSSGIVFNVLHLIIQQDFGHTRK